METKKRVLQLLKEKSSTKQLVYRNLKTVFADLKAVLREISDELRAEMEASDKHVSVEYVEQGEFEVRLSFSGDTLVFVMHTNVFTFDPQHWIHNLPYVKKDHLAPFCGVIQIYNFLADSFRYNRVNDIGTMIGRLFVNKDNHFFVEGDRQFSFKYNQFVDQQLDKGKLYEIVCIAMLYALDYDLYAPPLNVVGEISVQDIMQWEYEQRSRTVKRVGYRAAQDEKK